MGIREAEIMRSATPMGATIFTQFGKPDTPSV